MKKIFVILLLMITAGCSSSTIKESNNISQKDIKGYWLQIEENWSGDVEDLTNNPYAYLEITDKEIYFYTISFDENEGYSVAKKYYKIVENKLYYDYDELKDRSLDEISNSVYGGIFNVSFKENNLILLEYSNNVNEEDGYTKNTYKKVNVEDWPIEE